MELTKEQQSIKKQKLITHNELKKRLNYDKDTGIFTWNSNRVKKIGSIAGHKSITDGYVRIALTTNGVKKLYSAHRLAWLHEFGKFPHKHIDHLNHDRSDNRICNLREADHLSNNKNRSMSILNKSGFVGVYWHKSRKMWKVDITVKNKKIFIGQYKDKSEAICARLHTNKLYSFHANHGKEIV